MLKVVTSYVDGHYYPKVLSDEEAREYESFEMKTFEVSEETMKEWKEHCKQIETWHKFWMEVDSKIWEDD
jgi:hypothetical protein